MSKTVAVLGVGKFGRNIAKTLYQEGQEVLAVDKDKNAINEIADFVTHAYIGDTTDERVLNEIGIRDFDYVVISLSSNIRDSAITTVLCKELGAKYIIAKAVDNIHAKLLEKTGADMVVQPEKEAGIRLAKTLVADNIIDFLELSDEYSIHETRISSSWVGKTLIQLNVRQKYDVSVVGIRRNSQMMVNIDPNEPLLQDDILIMIGSNKGLDTIHNL
ncbi:MAG: TrkA family potassium uptake protein [Erysipelotrichaceae bacterium]|nr:TrkA family potassium uptake protein [Erysipelotrichaceae bacterium]